MMNSPGHTTAPRLKTARFTIPPVVPCKVSAAPVRVLHLVNGEHYAGAERVQDLLAAQLAEDGFEVGFACLKAGKFSEYRRCTAAPLYDTPMRSRWDFRPVSQIARIVRENNYRLLHAHTPRTGLIGRWVAAQTGVPIVYHVHSPTSRDSVRRCQNWLNARIERFSVRGMARLITVSRSLADHMQRRGYSADRIAVVHNGVPPPATAIARQPPAGTWTLGTVALFRPRKGMEVLLDALAALKQKGLPVRLTAVGNFETRRYEQNVKSRVVQLGLQDHVHWLGFAQDVNRLLASMDVFVLPSLFGEGLPMVLLEAMAAGVPVVATRVEGVAEVVRDEIDGLLARPYDAQQLAHQISRLVSGQVEWSSLRRRALDRYHSGFSHHTMARGVADVYREILDA